MYIPFIGALALASGTILERIVLKIKKINITFYQKISFLSIVLTMLPFLYFFWKLSPEALEIKNIIILLAIIIIAITANLLVFYSLKWEKVSRLEPARILEPLFVIILTVILSFFITSGVYEKNIKIIIPALIASLALVFSHIKKHHLDFNKYFIAAIFGSFFFALELVLSQLILNFYSPLTFYFFRSLGVFVISLLIFRSKTPKLEKNTFFLIFITGMIWVVYRIALYYGYATLGILSTTLVIMLGPVLIYIFAVLFLKEKLELRNIVAAVIIIACVAYAMLM